MVITNEKRFNPAPSSFQKHATWRAAMSYVSGSHNMKWGYQAGYMSNINTTYVGRQISYRFNNGLPNQMSQRVGTNETSNSLLYNGFYMQDQWTRKRLTLQGALRFESASSWAPAGENGIIGDNEFGGPNLIPRTEGVHGYHDIGALPVQLEMERDAERDRPAAVQDLPVGVDDQHVLGTDLLPQQEPRVAQERPVGLPVGDVPGEVVVVPLAPQRAGQEDELLAGCQFGQQGVRGGHERRTVHGTGLSGSGHR